MYINYSLTYRWRQLGYYCKQEPNDTLSDGHHVSGEGEPTVLAVQELSELYLFPEQAS